MTVIYAEGDYAIDNQADGTSELHEKFVYVWANGVDVDKIPIPAPHPPDKAYFRVSNTAAVNFACMSAQDYYAFISPGDQLGEINMFKPCATDAFGDDQVVTISLADNGNVYAVSSGTQLVEKDGSSGTVTLEYDVHADSTIELQNPIMSDFAVMFAYPVEVQPLNLTLNLPGTTTDSDGNANILIGQGCTGILIQAGVTLSNFQWSIPGDTFANFEMGETPWIYLPPTPPHPYGHVNYVDPSEYQKPNPHWYWKKGGDSGDEQTISVTADASYNGQSIGTVTAEKKVKVWKPTSSFTAKGGPAAVNNGTGGVQGPVAFSGEVGIPDLFNGPGNLGSWLPTQLCDLNRTDTDSRGNTFRVSTYGLVLDAEFNYGSISTYDPSPWPVDDPTATPIIHHWDDLPEHPLDGVAASVHDTFNTYIMFMPPGADIQWVPLHEFVWHWDVDMTKTGTTELVPWLPDPPGSVTVNGNGQDTGDFPSWTDSYSP